MTIVETERDSAPPKEREDAREERERRARVLEAAALEIEVRGWRTERVALDDGPTCLMGGVWRAIGSPWNGEYPWYNATAKTWGCDGHDVDELCRFWRFNDTVATGAADVTFLLRWRAEEIRDGR